MTKSQIKVMEAVIKSQIEYKTYCWEQAGLFDNDPQNERFFKSYQDQYYQATTKLEGMLYIYAIATDRTKYEIEQAIILKEEWRHSL